MKNDKSKGYDEDIPTNTTGSEAPNNTTKLLKQEKKKKKRLLQAAAAGGGGGGDNKSVVVVIDDAITRSTTGSNTTRHRAVNEDIESSVIIRNTGSQKKLRRSEDDDELAERKTKNATSNDETITNTTQQKDAFTNSKSSSTKSSSKSSSSISWSTDHPRPFVESSAQLLSKPYHDETRLAGSIDEDKDSVDIEKEYPISLLLFYQYIYPLWNDSIYQNVQDTLHNICTSFYIHGRIRVAKEGLNCTLSGTSINIKQFCYKLRQYMPHHFYNTEFKITHHLEQRYHFSTLKIIPVVELVHYGLDGGKSIGTTTESSSTTATPTVVPSPEVLEQYSGTHLEPSIYHQKLSEPNTIVIDVRNHYEATIGHFHVPSSTSTTSNTTDRTGSKNDDSNDHGNDKEKEVSNNLLDPKMRKSTEFPIWLDHPKTKEQLKGKQVLMYCTGGIRCERASALLQYKIQNDPTVKELNIQGVYQLQGGIDKYFKEFPDGGYWVGKNYTFDKRCAHTPIEISEHNPDTTKQQHSTVPLGKCASCSKPWDNYGGKPCRCPTCGVPNLICKDCYITDKKKIKRIRCDLCVEQNVRSKKELREKEIQELLEFEQRNQSLVTTIQKQHPNSDTVKSNATSIFTTNEKPSIVVSPNTPSSDISDKHFPMKNVERTTTTRLFLRNMCRNTMTEEILLDVLPQITHIVWKVDGKNGKFFGQGWVEMENIKAAELAVLQSGKINVCGRKLYIEYQPPDGKDLWPPPRSAVKSRK